VRWLSLLLVCSCASDPASTFASRKDARNLDCVRLGQAEAARLYPGVVPGPEVRGANLATTDALVCKRALLEPGERSARDEVILSSLTREVGELVKLASALEPAADTLWHVDAFYPDARVAAKIADAARTTLAEHGRAVSDRVPLLAAGDVAVVSTEPPKEAFPAACARYFSERSLVAPSVFLGLMIIDAREAELHAGVCALGRWRWLR
jgi:hypothetical protein